MRKIAKQLQMLHSFPEKKWSRKSIEVGKKVMSLHLLSIRNNLAFKLNVHWDQKLIFYSVPPRELDLSSISKAWNNDQTISRISSQLGWAFL